MFASIAQYFYPDLQQNEIKKFGLLSGIFTLIIGSYWLLRELKDTIFFKIAFPESLGWAVNQGRLFQPDAKFWSVFVVIAAVIVYSKLVDIFKKHQLFYVICGFYGTIFGSVGIILLLKELYGAEFVGRIPLAAAGWVTYFAIESYGSLMVNAVFWSFTNSITDSASAKRGFPLIIACAQLGAITVSVLMILSEHIGAIWPLMLLATVFVGLIMVGVAYFMRVIPASDMVGNQQAHKTEKKKEGFFEGFFAGLILLFTRPYLLGVLAVSTLYEIAKTIVDYQMKAQAAEYPMFATETGFAKFMGIFGFCTNGLAFAMALLGTSHLMKKYGLRVCLMVYPVCFAIALLVLLAYYYLGNPTAGQLLWATFGVMMLVTGLSYAVNNPTKEMMYIPTSKDARYKSKGWIDAFGSRTAKATGARVSNMFKHSLTELMYYGSAISLALIGVWACAAFYVGVKNAQLIRDNKIVE